MKMQWLVGVVLWCSCSSTEGAPQAERGTGGTGHVETEGGPPVTGGGKGSGGAPGTGGGPPNCGGAIGLCTDVGVHVAVTLGRSREEASSQLVTACRGLRCVQFEGSRFFAGGIDFGEQGGPTGYGNQTQGDVFKFSLSWYPTPAEVAALPDGEQFSVVVRDARGDLVDERRVHVTYRTEARGASFPGCGGPQICVIPTLRDVPPEDGGVSVEGGTGDGGGGTPPRDGGGD